MLDLGLRQVLRLGIFASICVKRRSLALRQND